MNRGSAWFRRRRSKRRGQKWKRAHGTNEKMFQRRELGPKRRDCRRFIALRT